MTTEQEFQNAKKNTTKKAPPTPEQIVISKSLSITYIGIAVGIGAAVILGDPWKGASLMLGSSSGAALALYYSSNKISGVHSKKIAALFVGIGLVLSHTMWSTENNKLNQKNAAAAALAKMGSPIESAEITLANGSKSYFKPQSAKTVEIDGKTMCEIRGTDARKNLMIITRPDSCDAK